MGGVIFFVRFFSGVICLRGLRGENPLWLRVKAAYGSMMSNEDGQVDRFNDQPGMAGFEEAGQHAAAIGAHDNDAILPFYEEPKEFIRWVACQYFEFHFVIMLLQPFLHFELIFDGCLFIAAYVDDRDLLLAQLGKEMRELFDGK